MYGLTPPNLTDLSDDAIYALPRLAGAVMDKNTIREHVFGNPESILPFMDEFRRLEDNQYLHASMFPREGMIEEFERAGYIEKPTDEAYEGIYINHLRRASKSAVFVGARNHSVEVSVSCMSPSQDLAFVTGVDVQIRKKELFRLASTTVTVYGNAVDEEHSNVVLAAFEISGHEVEVSGFNDFINLHGYILSAGGYPLGSIPAVAAHDNETCGHGDKCTETLDMDYLPESKTMDTFERAGLVEREGNFGHELDDFVGMPVSIAIRKV